MTYDAEEVVVHLADGWTLHSGVYDPTSPDALTSGEYVRLCDEQGEEYAYWDQEEWRTDPALVMGAIINSAAGLRPEKKEPDEPSPYWSDDDLERGERFAREHPVTPSSDA